MKKIMPFVRIMPKIFAGDFNFDMSLEESVSESNSSYIYFKTDTDGVKYHGQTNASGMKDGVGISVDLDGKVYFGGWYQDKYHGPGCLIDKENTVILGNWDNGFANGNGRKFWSLGGKSYEGPLELSKASGTGELKWANGAHYEGQFKDDLMHGEGHLTEASGRTYEGLFVKGLM